MAPPTDIKETNQSCSTTYVHRKWWAQIFAVHPHEIHYPAESDQYRLEVQYMPPKIAVPTDAASGRSAAGSVSQATDHCLEFEPIDLHHASLGITSIFELHLWSIQAMEWNSTCVETRKCNVISSRWSKLLALDRLRDIPVFTIIRHSIDIHTYLKCRSKTVSFPKKTFCPL